MLDRSKPGIEHVFADPYDPETSFWLHEDIGGLTVPLRDADTLLATAGVGAARRPLMALADILPQKHRRSFLRRAVYNHMYLRPSETRQFSIPVAPGFLESLRPRFKGSTTEFLIAEPPQETRSTMEDTRRRNAKLYGVDLMRSAMSVRYANDQIDIPYRNAERNNVDAHLLTAMHCDQKKGITTISYLTEVTDQSGCFAYLDGSDRMKQSVCLRALHETFMHDMKLTTREDAVAAGVPGTIFNTIAYGESLTPEKKAKAIPFIRRVTGPPGTTISFAGNVLVHGGGWPMKGERIALFFDHYGRFTQRAKHLASFHLNFGLRGG